MQTQFDFDAEGVVEKPLRPRRKRKRDWRKQLKAGAIKQLIPKLLSNAMPRVILKEDYLQRPRSAESEFGLKWQAKSIRVVGRSNPKKVKDDLWGKPIPPWRQKAEPFTVDPNKWAAFLKSQQKS